MKKVPTIVAICTLAILPLGIVVAEGLSTSKPAITETKAAETKTIKLKITGMT